MLHLSPLTYIFWIYFHSVKRKIDLYYYYYYLLLSIFHSVAVILTLVQTKQIRINTHKRNNTKNSTNNKTQ